MKTVYLHGNLGKCFGEKWELAVCSIGEVMQAIEANNEGFLQYIIDRDKSGEEYVILKKDPGKIKNEQEIENCLIEESSQNLSELDKEIHILPLVSGAGLVTAIVGAISAIATKAFVVKLAISLIAGIAMQAIMKPPKPPERKTPTSTKSFLLSGSRTRQAQGIAVPLGYGRLKIGATNVAEKRSSRKIKESSNSKSLESYSEMEFLDILCEGPIEGFVNKYGAKIFGSDIREAIFLNDVQVKSTENQTLNYILNEYEDSNVGLPSFKIGQTAEEKIMSDEVFAIKEYNTLLYGPGPYNK